MNAFVERFEQARQCWNAGDFEGYVSVYDDSIKLHGYTPQPMTKEAVVAFYRQVWAALGQNGKPNPDLVFYDMMTDRDLCCCRFAISGVQRGTFRSFPATGKPYVMNGITMLRHASNRIVERWSSADMLGVLTQIGAIPPPA